MLAQHAACHTGHTRAAQSEDRTNPTTFPPAPKFCGRPADPMTNDKRFEITGIDALSRDMFAAFERAAVAEKPKRRKRPAPAKPGPKPDHGDGLFPPISASLTETQATDPNDLSAISASLPSLAGMVEKPLLPELYQKAMVAIEAACPNGVPVERWQRALADAGSFFALWGDTAERLGRVCKG